MVDLDDRLRRLDRIPAPDLWPAVQAAQPSPLSRRRPRIPLSVGGGVLVIVLAVVTSVAVLDRRGDGGREVRVGGGQTPSAPRVLSSVPIAPAVAAVTTGFGSVWVGVGSQERDLRSPGDRAGSVVRVDPVSRRVVASIPLRTGANGLAVGEGAVWAVGGGDGGSPEAFLLRIDPVANAVSGRLALDGAYQVAVGHGAIWVSGAQDRLWRIDPVRMEVQASVAVDRGVGVAATGDAVWVTRPDAGTVDRVDPSRNAVIASIPLGRFPNAVAAGGQTVWVSNYGDGTVSAVDPATNSVRSTLRVGGAPYGLAEDGAGSLWVASQLGPPNASPTSVLRVDVATGERSAPVEVGQVRGLAWSGQALWVTDQTQGSVLEIR